MEAGLLALVTRFYASGNNSMYKRIFYPAHNISIKEENYILQTGLKKYLTFEHKNSDAKDVHL